MKKAEIALDIVNMALGLVATSMAVFIVWFEAMEFVNNI